MALHAVIKPTNLYTVSQADQKFWSVSSAEINDIQNLIETLNRKSVVSNSSIQPFIIVVGVDISNLVEFYVSFGKCFYKFNSFIIALDICLKLFSSSYPIHTDGVSASSIFSSIRNTCRKETWKSRYNTLQRKMGPHTEIDLVFQCFIQYFFVYELRDFVEKEMNWNSNSAVITKFVLVQVQEKEVISSRK